MKFVDSQLIISGLRYCVRLTSPLSSEGGGGRGAAMRQPITNEGGNYSEQNLETLV